MTVALFVPCYIDQLYPHVARATLELLEKQGVTVAVPPGQTCCGQPMANAGCEHEALPVYRHFVETFAGYDHVVAPSGSCTYHVRHHYERLPASEAVAQVRAHTWELCQFLREVLAVTTFNVTFPYHVGLHPGCHGQRGLRLAPASERPADPTPDVLRTLLQSIDGLTLTTPDRADECCGFGGTFSGTEAAVSARMGRDRLHDYLRNGTEVLTSGDMSCLVHLDGLIRRERLPLRVMHIAEILNGYLPEGHVARGSRHGV